MSQQTIDLIRGGYEAFARRDLPHVFSFLHPDIEYYQTDLLPWGGRRHGRIGMMAMMAKLFLHIESRFEPVEFVDAGNHVVAIGRIRGRAKSTGREFDVRGIHVWTIQDQTATRLEVYVDTPQLLEALQG